MGSAFRRPPPGVVETFRLASCVQLCSEVRAVSRLGSPYAYQAWGLCVSCVVRGRPRISEVASWERSIGTKYTVDMTVRCRLVASEKKVGSRLQCVCHDVFFPNGLVLRRKGFRHGSRILSRGFRFL